MGGQNDKFAELLCIKRLEFSHENEVRILANDYDDTNGASGCYRIPFNTNDILNEICVDPRLDNLEANKLIENIRNLGVTVSVIQSPLYKITNMPRIRLE